MKKTLVIIVIQILLLQTLYSQINEGLVELAKTYKLNTTYLKKISDNQMKSLEKYESTELAFPANFLLEDFKKHNSTLSVDSDFGKSNNYSYLKRPNDKELRYLYIINHISKIKSQDNSSNNLKLVNELLEKDIQTSELIHNYYSMAVGFVNLSNLNISLDSIELRNAEEKSIVFLEIMRMCGLKIWGNINLASPPNYNASIKIINNYPTFNWAPYYKFLDLEFPDFQIYLYPENKTQSYKEFYLDKYYETLLNHLTCLIETHQEKRKIDDLISGSLLNKENFFKYSKNASELKDRVKKYKK